MSIAKIKESSSLTAGHFIEHLSSLSSADNRASNMGSFRGEDSQTESIGIRFKTVFDLAKAYIDMPLDQIDALLASNFYEVRIGAVSIMDFQARRKGISAQKRAALFHLYINRHDRLNNWDFVDRAAPYVVGGYLYDKPRDILYQLARSQNVWERRTAIVSTYFFIRQDDLDDTFAIAEILVNDEHDLVNKAVGSWLREAGKRDEARLRHFLDKHAATMPRVTLRYAVEKFDKAERKRYLEIGRN